MKNLRVLCSVGGVALALAIGLSACGRKKEAAPAVAPTALSAPSMPNPSSTAVTVDGFIITWGQVIEEMQRLQPNSSTPITAKLAAVSLVVRRLLSLAADKTQLVIAPQDINRAVENVRRQVPTNTTLEAVLRSNNVSEVELRKNILESLKVNRLLQQQLQKATVATDVEITQFTRDNPRVLSVPENVTVRTILVAVQPGDDAATRKTKKTKADNTRMQLLTGGDFAKLAATVSDDPRSKLQGGLLPPLQRGMIKDKTFEDAAFTQKAGVIGPVLDTQFGYVILQVQQHAPPSLLKLDDVKERLRTLITEQKRQRTMQEYIAGLRAKAKIVYAQPSKT